MDTLRWRDIELSKGRVLALSIYRSLRDNQRAKFGIHIEIPYLLNLFVPIYYGHKEYPYDAEMWASWGFTTFDNSSIHLNWGEKCKILYMPWSWEWVRTSYLEPDGKTWLHDTDKTRMTLQGFDRFDYFRQAPKWREVYDFRYVRNNGEIQDRKATVTVEEREWRWNWFRWLPFPRRVHRTISIDFDKEVGERSGSWKGR